MKNRVRGLDTRSLREIFAERKELIAKYVPAETQAIHAQAVAELKMRQLAANVLPLARRRLAFELPDHDGKLVSSAELARQRKACALFHSRALVSVLRRADGSDEPGPAARSSRLERRCVAISPQNVKQSFFMHDQHKLRFRVALRCGQQSRAAVWADVPRAAAAGSGLSARLRESALHERRRELGVADSGNLHSRSRWNAFSTLRRTRITPSGPNRARS